MEDRSPVAIVRHELEQLRHRGPIPPVLESPGFDPAGGGPKFEAPPGPGQRAETGLAPEAWVLLGADEALGSIWPYLYQAAAAGGPGPRVLARFDPNAAALPVGDLAAFGSIPLCRVAAPPDAATTRALLRTLKAEPGPTYARIPAGEPPTTGAGTFGWAHAPTLRDGVDITLVGVGPALEELRALATRLEAIGISARLLDGSSVKPIDAATVVRAARETGAILVAEEHHALTGYGAAVAALTSLAYPVPVRRVGYPDLPAGGHPTGGVTGRARYGLTPSRLDEEAWELLKARGKVQ